MRENDWSAIVEWSQNLGWDETGSRGWINNRFKEGEGREQPINQVKARSKLIFPTGFPEAKRAKLWMK